MYWAHGASNLGDAKNYTHGTISETRRLSDHE